MGRDVRARSNRNARARGPSFALWGRAPREFAPRLLAIVVALLLASLITAAAALAQLSDPRFPALSGRIVDEAGLLSAGDRADILARLAALEAKSTDQVVVVTVKSLQDYAIEDYAIRLARHWKIGQQGTDNGVVLLVAPNERKVRIEVGRGLEGQLTDSMSALIINNAILPAFRRGEFGAGVRAGLRDITDVLLGDAEAVKQRAARLKPRGGDLDPIAIMFLLFWLFVFAIVIYAHIRQSRTMPAGQSGRFRRSRQGRSSPEIIVIPGSWGGSGNWGGGGGGGGGGWSGGGGGFGGGGSSGSW